MLERLPEELEPLLVEQLREQMNHISAVAQLLAPVVREQCGPRYDQYLAILNQSMYRMMRTLNNLEFAQLPEGEEVFRPAGLDLAGLALEVAEQTEGLASQAGVRFIFEREKATLLTCGDEALLRRMLFNLISNALRAAGQGGQAGLRLSSVRGRVLLTVWDNGAGLAQPEDGDYLLKRPDGLGLGLLVARRIARLHGGTLVLEQREDRGLRAVVSLPVQPPEKGSVLCTPQMGYDGLGGFSPALLELSSVLPYQAFLPADEE